MGYYVMINITFEIDATPHREDGVKSDIQVLAREHRARLPHEHPEEAHQFLDAIGAGGCIHCGHKGEVCTWGVIGNYTRAVEVLDALRPFLRECYQWGFIMSGPDVEYTNRVVVTWEAEQSGTAHCLVFGITEDGVEFTEEHELPFCWGQ